MGVYISLKVLLIILAVLIAACASLFLSVICIKLIQARREKKKEKYMSSIRPVLKKLFNAETVEFFKKNNQILSKLANELKERAALQTLEDLLLDILEYEEGEKKVRARTIAYFFGFPEKCVHLIRERLTSNIAIGCRKAGLYQYEEAVPDILKALRIVSSETQLQALMAIARIGDIDAMVQAFDKIYRLILINERAVQEVLSVFSGDRYELYKRMIHHKSAYLVHHFLKGIDDEIAAKLIDDIIALPKEQKEMRLACIVAVGKSGDRKKIPLLVQAIQDPEWEIRAAAAKTLGVLTGPGAIRALARAARDREWWVRQNAVTSILAYPNREKTLVSIARTGDRFAYDSMLYAIGKAREAELLQKIREVWLEKLKNSNLIESVVF